ncbi:MAG TPA: sugar kinase [Devosiaceae bacterium]
MPEDQGGPGLPRLDAGRRVLVVGDVMTDVIARPEGPVIKGSDRRARIRTRPGGSGANQAVWLAHLGVPVTFAARVGADDLDRIRDRLGKFGTVPRLAADPELPTGVLVTLVDPDGERSFLTDRGANLALSAGDLPDDLLDGVALLAISGYSLFEPGPRAAVLDLMARARERGVRVAVDPASASFLAECGIERFLDWTQGATLVLPNAEEAQLLTGETDIERQLAVLGARYDIVVVKRGAQGAEAIRGGVRFAAKAPEVAVLDTTGAGDAFLAGFVRQWLGGASLQEALGAGVAAGSRATTHFGGQPPERPD